MVFEALGRGLVVEPLLGAVMVGEAIAAAGSDAQKELLAEIIGGSTIAALAHDEAGAHYELARVQTRAERSGDGWVLDGAKAVVQQGEQADLFLVSARTAGAVGRRGRHLAVPGAREDAGRRRCAAARRSTAAAWPNSRFDGVKLGADALLGAEGQGHAALERAIGRGVLALCAESLGAMEAAKTATLEYLRTRKQFGMLIGSFQALQHRMADLLLEIEQARSAVINAAAAIEAPTARRASARCRRPRSASAASARWWPKRASRCTAASA